MYKSVQIKDFCLKNDGKLADKFNKISLNEIKTYKSNIEKAYLKPLETYLLDGSNDIFSADKIQQELFSTLKNVDIFLSHTHSDEDKVIKLALYLQNIGLNVFVDSCVWGNAFELLREIDNKYCRHTNGSSYSYEARNYSTANIYMILNTALHKMIDESELFLFLSSKQSLKVGGVIDGSSKESVQSPWIYSELMFTNQVIRRNLIRMRDSSESYKDQTLIESEHPATQPPKFDYLKPELDYAISNDLFNDWLLNKGDSQVTFNSNDNDPFRRIKAGELLDDFYKHIEKNAIKRSINERL